MSVTTWTSTDYGIFPSIWEPGVLPAPPPVIGWLAPVTDSAGVANQSNTGSSEFPAQP